MCGSPVAVRDACAAAGAASRGGFAWGSGVGGTRGGGGDGGAPSLLRGRLHAGDRSANGVIESIPS